ncbi:MAG: hypothetical protein C4520_04490 [Candidatus Abyssobacteria bacterium SURF_5]|uniref:Uncharacterized protein n=1 Tax=Abyssobacteria bacterium (strain SURF_5) TaxID=2093360 RepID=A0A3A4P1G4_ABYX5|nr:MAG: hypothetical protein C4520_04490 [Candidatus Abyssubacteria bacterium SURF_5]
MERLDETPLICCCFFILADMAVPGLASRPPETNFEKGQLSEITESTERGRASTKTKTPRSRKAGNSAKRAKKLRTYVCAIGIEDMIVFWYRVPGFRTAKISTGDNGDNGDNGRQRRNPLPPFNAPVSCHAERKRSSSLC